MIALVMRKRVLILAPLALLAVGAGAVYFAAKPPTPETTVVLDSDGQRGGDLAVGIALFADDDLETAQAHFASILEQYPGEIRAVYYLGRVAFAQQRFEESVALLQQAADADPDIADHHYWLANARGRYAMTLPMLQQGAMSGTIITGYKRAVELDPDHVQARQGLVMLNIFLPGFLGGDIDEAKMHADEIARIDEYRGRLANAMIAAKEKDTDKQLRLLERCVELEPDRPEAYPQLIRVLQESGRTDDAVDSCRALIALGKPGITGYYQLGRLGAVTGEYLDEAEESLHLFITLDTISSIDLGQTIPREWAYFRLGEVLAHKDDPDAARQAFLDALEINPELAQAKQALADLDQP